MTKFDIKAVQTEFIALFPEVLKIESVQMVEKYSKDMQLVAYDKKKSAKGAACFIFWYQ